mmetsp:Transcript_7134/g.11294  ORF Transcript_7134/g.11294 Transcript_7134/m.11294 type:complete len:1094 (-) Transcript_7134:624-3905(-)
MANNNPPNPSGPPGAYNNNPNNRRLPSAWQPAAPTSTLQASAGAAPYAYAPPQHQQYAPQQNHYGANPYGYPQQGQRPYYPQQQYYQQQQTQAAQAQVQQQQSQQQQQQPQAPAYQPPTRERRSLIITDKDGNPIDLSSNKKKPSSSNTAAASSTTPADSSSAGNKLLEAVKARIAGDSKKKEDNAGEKAAAEKAAADKKRREEAEAEALKKKAEEEAERKAAEAAKAVEEEAKRRAEEEEANRPKGKRRVYSKSDLLRFKEMDSCVCHPPDLPDMTIERGPSRNNTNDRNDRRGNRDGGNTPWSRGVAPPRRQSSNNFQQQQQQPQPQQNEWQRGQAPPPPPKNKGGRGNNQRGGYPEPSMDFKPLVKSDNSWKPKKNESTLIILEKKVKSILNKMTKEKFQKLSTQMCEIPLESYDTLTMMISHVYEKAIDEPSFGELYAELCTMLSAAASTSSFVHYIESDEERENGSPVVWRWSNDVSHDDAELVGPFEDDDDAIEAALAEETMEPIERGELELELVRLKIAAGTFIKVLKSTENDDHYVVFFPVKEAEECGQTMSEFFLTERECKSDASKHNSFKRSLLNKCQDEFSKKDIYDDWTKEMDTYKENKKTMTDAEQAEKAEELEFRRIKIKKQMLGNIKFIGQLYKAGLLKEKIMRYCIGDLLKLEEDESIKNKNPEYVDPGKDDLDEEDHEACVSMFTTIGKTIDNRQASSFMSVCFNKMERFSDEKSLVSRVRFMYKDLIELRSNNWVPRRKQEKAKTLDEIRKDVEREERIQAQQSQQQGYGGGRGGGRGGNRKMNNDRNSFRGGGDNRRQNQSDFQRSSVRKPQVLQTDDDGFAVVQSGKGRASVPRGSTTSGSRRSPPKTRTIVTPPRNQGVSSLRPNASSPPPQAAPTAAPTAAPLSKDKLERRIDNIRAEYMQDPNNVEELLLSMGDLSGTPNSSFTFVQRNADRIMDCKDDERKAINDMVVLLFQKGKLSKADIGNGMAEIIEFIDSFVIDSPRAYEYLGDTISSILNVGAVDIGWLIEQANKTKITPDTDAPERIVKETMVSFSNKYGKDTAKSTFTSSADKMVDLVGNDKWNSISSSVLS